MRYYYKQKNVTKFVRASFCSPVLARNICLETYLENSCNVLVVTYFSQGMGPRLSAAQRRRRRRRRGEEE